MIILAVDSTSPFASAVILDGGKRKGEIFLYGGNTHSESLLPAVDALLRTLHIGYDDIDCYAVCVGPGSFTGVRIGVSTVKGLAFGRGKPCVPVSTLECLSRNLAELPEGSILCPVMDARRQSVFQAFFGIEGGRIARITEDRRISLAELREEIENRFPKSALYLCGDGYAMAKEALAGIAAVKDTPQMLASPSAYGAAVLAEELLESGGDLSAYTDRELVPVYLAPSQAERERTEKSARLYGD